MMPEEEPAFVAAYRETQEMFNSIADAVSELEDAFDSKKLNIVSVKNQPSPK